MAIKKKVNGTWQPITPKQLKGVPYTGTLPAVITGTKAGYLHRYKIYGNLSQNGTPTPENPIVPQECGERTANLFDFETKQTTCNENAPVGASYAYLTSGTSYRRITTTDAIPTSGNAISWDDTTYDIYICYCNVDKTYTGVHSSNWVTASPLVFADYPYASLTIRKKSGANIDPNELDNVKVMLNSGSTALPYEPYGYKLPLTSAGQNVDIYLGESQTTRLIKKLVFDGTENWRTDDGRFAFRVTDIKSQGLRRTNFYCSSYQVISDGREYADVPNNAIYTGGGDSSGAIVYIHTDGYTTITSFKAYLAQQYSNGTPVTIWYPLMTPTTGTLNEPLRKIGNYADTIDSTQTSAQIPTTANTTTISWGGSGLAPSQFDSIQEWVDIPTYTYTNGEWVADN